MVDPCHEKGVGEVGRDTSRAHFRAQLVGRGWGREQQQLDEKDLRCQ